MYLNDIYIQGVASDLQATDVVLEAVFTLKELLRDRAKVELAEVERRRNSLLELMGEAPAPAPQEDKPRRSGGVMPAKYRNPENPAQMWSGRGKKPNWVIQHLANPANCMDDLLIP
jgi:DNA-binding protein H-NS